jgi:YegS/Rv2252/BmrU family lipid kinase
VDLARRGAHAEFDCVVALGGDGTVHEIANGLLEAGGTVALGVVPVGSGDDFAKLVGSRPHDVAGAVAHIVAGRVRRFDVGRALDEYFVNSMGFGFGPHVVRTRNAMPGLRGFLSYLVPVVHAFFSFEPPAFELTVAGTVERGRMMLIEVCNGTTAGGSYRFAPDADVSDGRLDVCLVRRVSLPRFLLALPRVMRGTHTTMRECTMLRATTLTVRTPGTPLLVHLDGELRDPETEQCRVTLEPARLPVRVAA